MGNRGGNRGNRGIEGNRGTLPLFNSTCSFLGRPAFPGKIRRDSFSSSFFMNPSLPSGRPVEVACLIFCSVSGSCCIKNCLYVSLSFSSSHPCLLSCPFPSPLILDLQLDHLPVSVTYFIHKLLSDGVRL